ncbi:hypothetical protein KIH87_11525 [Paraneptunicella aestuarii]|uniref:hypothetical protein n=1 Tax=Paraneptunicella aestuarii TaxID=2831148 RepID=UPI001E3F87AD|nr:hypothetical protein [Paraneptunicella aestuarii]UAA37353.1 hypothetical protein KIH87_11525 [Paraneptunicella aestuarii]
MSNSTQLLKNLKGVVIGTVVLASTMLTGCIQSNAAEKFAYSSTAPVSESAIKAVNSSFYTNFAAGGWYYKGAEAINGTINAYIQIPSRLDMNQSDQKNYLRQAICPSTAKKEFWNQLQGIPLSVHIYTYNKKFTVYAHCENPTV